MRADFPTLRRVVAAAAAASLLAAGLAVAAGPAVADTAPTDPGIPATVAADGLPTVQIDGVAWSQVIVGGTVYVAGQFTTARPAGAAAGTSTTARANLLAYDLASGELITSWAPTLNGPAYVITASPDGTRLYVGGDFTRVNGATQNRFAVLNRATGQRVTSFNPNPNAAVRAIAATASTVYFGGNFTTANGNTRNRLAAVSATTGALLSWTASAQSAQVEAMVLSPDNTRLIVAGRFERLAGVAARGSGALSTTTAAVLPWAANQVVQNYGYQAGVTSLSSDGTWVYGTGFILVAAGGTGNLEGAFAANVMTGAVRWIEDCHGDTYSVFANPGGDAIYTVGHAYFCGNIGGYPEKTGFQGYAYAQAFSKQDVMTITPGVPIVTHPSGTDWQGRRAPALLDYFPAFTPGAATGQGQAGWSVTGTADYVVYGGEFLTVNGQPQQGLVRMAVSTLSTNDLGPQGSANSLRPTATSEAAGTVQVSWPTTSDPDNERLTYQVFRDGGTTPVYETTAQSLSWQLPRISFTDTGLVEGATHTYVVVASDPFGNSLTSPSVTVTVSGGTAVLGAYAQQVLLDNPAGYWRLGEADGNAQDWTGFADSTVGAEVTRDVAGALTPADDDGAAQFAGTAASRVYGSAQATTSNRFSIEAWFRTTSTTGGKIVGFGDSRTGDSVLYDRDVLLGADGRLTFGVNPNSLRTVTTPGAYNDGAWHHVVATLSSAGQQLYVDGALRASRTDTVSSRSHSTGRQGQTFRGYWRIGGDSSAIWPEAGAPDFTGDIDEVAVYGRALTAAQVAAHFTTAGGTPTNQDPVASFASTADGLSVSVDASASADPDGSIAGYDWTFGDGGTATGVTATHAYAAAGTYTVTLTVTDSGGATATAQGDVTVTAPAVPGIAADAFGRTVDSGLGTADLGGAWATTAGATSVTGTAGRLALASAGATVSARLPGATGTSLRTQVTESWDKRPAGSGGWFLLRGRITTGGEYRLRVAHRANGVVTARLVRTTAAGVETALTPEVTVAGLTYTPGSGVVAVVEVTGTSPTTLRGKVWASTSTEPTAWNVTATDSTAALQGSGHTGLAALASSSATNVPVAVQIDDFSVTTIG
ncbi:LamG-like jellyroll fold domain-containing protein [Pengzhenrongella sicca]|uniref:PKD domain-containing protein n=1 Tax=Pengzhenrongella sicca TaxID=2819238 RepID=A0A8A4ZGY1_9MICO|nr:LamG-like jellyroll fold domain-containing protein [Pengzhenrongella sicca]QTE28898.1 PKD domain-containing protein [Pengzhenrongella sicca]